MKVLAWLTEGTWEACVDVARSYAGHEFTLLYVTDSGTAAALNAPAGLLGRSARPADALLTEAGQALLDAAADRLGHPAERVTRLGMPEREVVTRCADADLLILARDGDHTRLGPKSLGRATRFVVDHAPCQVLLVWPDAPPRLATIPPPPSHPGHHPPPHPPHDQWPH
jgi:nucleotide-binding universal stress UspA family protein